MRVERAFDIHNIDGLHKFILFIPSIFHHPQRNVTFRRVQRGSVLPVQRVLVIAGVRHDKTGGPRPFAASHERREF